MILIKNRLSLTALFILLISANAMADMVGTSCYSPKDKIAFPIQSIQLVSGGCVGYIILPTATKPHRIVEFPFVGSGTLAINSQATGVVMLQDYLSGRYDRDKNKIYGGFSKENENPFVVYTYWDHKLTGKIRISEFIDPTQPTYKSIRESVSHIGFVKSHRYGKDGKILIIKNHADKKYQIHLPSGRIL